MKLKVKIIVATVVSLIIMGLIGIIMYIEIPRLSFEYSKSSDSYTVLKAYGNQESYTIPSYYKGKRVEAIGLKAFQNKSNLKEIVFEADTNIKYIRTLAFYNCDALEQINFPDSIIEIEKNAFMDCNFLKSISFSEKSQLAFLDGNVFYDCTNLEFVRLPKSLLEIGSYCFLNTSIKKILIYHLTALNFNALRGIPKSSIEYYYN